MAILALGEIGPCPCNRAIERNGGAELPKHECVPCVVTKFEKLILTFWPAFTPPMTHEPANFQVHLCLVAFVELNSQLSPS